MKKTFATMVSVFFLLCSSAFAATYYESKDSCEAASRAGVAVNYQPTAKHIHYGDARVAGLEKRGLEGDACVYLGAQPGKRWVFLKQGTQVYTKGADVKLLAECQNDVYQAVYIKSNLVTPSAPTTGETCQSDGCGNVTKTQIVTHVVKEVKVCEDSKGNRFSPVGDDCAFAATNAHVSMKVDAKAECLNCTTQSQPQLQPQQQKSLSCVGGDCKPQMSAAVVMRTPRDDGRCVVVVEDQGVEKFIRLETEKADAKGDLKLVAAIVNDKKADWVRTNSLTYVGDGVQTVALTKANLCSSAVKAFTSPRSFSWTAKRLGLSDSCKVKTAL